MALIGVAILAIVTLFVLVYPVIYVLIGSLKPGGGLLSQGGGFTFDNYLRIFRSGFGRFLINSLVICVAATLVSTVLSIMAAYALSRFEFRLKNVFFIGILFALQLAIRGVTAELVTAFKGSAVLQSRRAFMPAWTRKQASN